MSRKFVMLGLDGANPELIEQFLPELSNFRKLIKRGCWGPMLPVVPVDTPTNWTALATGATAAISRITGFDFYIPGTSLKNVLRPRTDYSKLRNAEFLWEAADRQGKKSLIINYPFSWYSKRLKYGVIVGGDSIVGGVSQITGWQCYCTPDRTGKVKEAREIKLKKEGSVYTAQLMLRDIYKREWSAAGLTAVGKFDHEYSKSDICIKTIPGKSPRLEIEGLRNHKICLLTPGEWSDYVEIKSGKEKGWVRFLLVDLHEDGKNLQLYHTMITRSKGWTKPARYASKLLEKVGPYQQGQETGGNMEGKNWFGELTMQVDMELLRKTGEILVGYAEHLTKSVPDWDNMYIQLHSTDGLNHRRLGHLDPSHPFSSPQQAEKAKRWFLEHYKVVDEIVGRVANLAEQNNAILCIVSDHSAVPTHTWVDTARPFQEKGWLNFDKKGDWDPSRSKIRKMINHSIYINLKGRQPDGIVKLQDYEKVRDEIISTLLNLRDPRTKRCPIALAARREDLESIGANGENFGDVVYFMQPGYTNQPASESHSINEEDLKDILYDAKKGMQIGYAFHRTIHGNHHDYLPNSKYRQLCSNRAILLFYGSGIRQGYRINGARTIDVAPTLAAISGISPPRQSEGNILNQIFKQ